MSVNDPIGDMLTRIRNAMGARKATVSMPSSTAKVNIAKVLKNEGYVSDFVVVKSGAMSDLTVTLKYYEGAPVIESIRRVSKPGRRVYQGKDSLPRVNGGLGISIISTSRGLMTDRAARAAGEGGEVLCVVS